jgi:hypothetical protein
VDRTVWRRVKRRLRRAGAGAQRKYLQVAKRRNIRLRLSRASVDAESFLKNVSKEVIRWGIRVILRPESTYRKRFVNKEPDLVNDSSDAFNKRVSRSRKISVMMTGVVLEADVEA